MFAFELIIPIYMGLIIFFILRSVGADPDATPEAKSSAGILSQFFMVFYTPYITMINVRFIVTSMVEDKKTKMRETLRLMSLSRWNYTMSFFVYQSCMSLWNGVIIGAIMFNNVNAFTIEDDRFKNSVTYIFIAIFLCVGMIGYSMALSTLFYDTKVGQNMSQLAIFIPLILFVAVVNKTGFAGSFLYLTMLTPIGPASALIGIITAGPAIPGFNPLINVDHLNVYVSWFFLFFNIPFWISIYIYLDQVMPNTYGIQRSPFFCCQKKQKIKEF